MKSCSPAMHLLASLCGGFLGGFLATQHTAAGFVAGILGGALILGVYWLVARFRERSATALPKNM